MASIYTTKQDEMLDAICWRTYGSASGFVEQVLDINPDLSALPLVLPIATRIVLPDLPREPAERKIISLWD